MDNLQNDPVPMLFLIGVLVIRAEVCSNPCHYRLQNRDNTLPKLGQ